MSDAAPAKILVVDDEPDLEPLMLQRMRRHIRKGTYEFTFARNGADALRMLSEDPGIDIVLSDINMPEMDGLAMLEQIPQINPDIRAVVVSAYGDMKNIRTAMNRGAFDFVTKPVDFKDLQITIARTLVHTRQWKEALSYRDKLVSLQNELQVASDIQNSILPSTFPETPQLEVFGSMVAAQDVGGDFFDVIALDRGRIGLVMADVSGKGVPAAMFMMTCRTLVKGVAIGLLNPGEVLGEVNNLLCEENETTQFVTVLYAVYDPETGSFTFASGGHDAPLVKKSRRLDGTATPHRRAGAGCSAGLPIPAAQDDHRAGGDGGALHRRDHRSTDRGGSPLRSRGTDRCAGKRRRGGHGGGDDPGCYCRYQGVHGGRSAVRRYNLPGNSED